jgi:hypothetical protein
MKQNIALKDKESLRKQINGTFNNISSTDGSKYHCNSFFLCHKLKSGLPSSISSQSWIFYYVVSVSPAALNTVCYNTSCSKITHAFCSMYLTVKRIFRFSNFDTDCLTSGSTVARNLTSRRIGWVKRVERLGKNKCIALLQPCFGRIRSKEKKTVWDDKQ